MSKQITNKRKTTNSTEQDSKIEEVLQSGIETILQAFELKNADCLTKLHEQKRILSDFQTQITVLKEENEILKQENTFYKKENEQLKNSNLKLSQSIKKKKNPILQPTRNSEIPVNTQTNPNTINFDKYVHSNFPNTINEINKTISIRNNLHSVQTMDNNNLNPNGSDLSMNMNSGNENEADLLNVFLKNYKKNQGKQRNLSNNFTNNFIKNEDLESLNNQIEFVSNKMKNNTEKSDINSTENITTTDDEKKNQKMDIYERSNLLLKKRILLIEVKIKIIF